MPLRPFTRLQLASATTTLPHTLSFRHLLPFPTSWLKRTSKHDPRIKSVRPRDRIKYWNVVPGDQIRLLGDKENVLREVLSVNKISNRVFVKGVVNSGEEDSDKIPPSKNYHYSRCQLFLGNYELPSPSAKGGAEVVPVFAQRLGQSKPYWNSFLRRIEWTRFATSTVPVVPHQKGERIPIPWPKFDKPPIPEPSQYDTLEEVVSKVTYKPPTFSPSPLGPIPRPPEEKSYLKALYNPHHRTESFTETSPPVEVYLQRELANPHSRAKKLARWKQYQFQKRQALDKFVSDELNELRGRTVREAKAEGVWKWREEMARQKEAERKRRWGYPANVARMERKGKFKERKEERLRRRLTALEVVEGKQDVVLT